MNPGAALRIEALFQDADLAVVSKPSGVTTHPDGATPPGFDLMTAARRSLGLEYLGVHHRLDREVSGVVVFAARREANAELARAFEGRQVSKQYLALARGELPASGAFESPVDGKSARTTFERLERRDGFCLVRLGLETGRTHQLRVHLSGAGCPIVGDVEYGGPPFPRLMLHAGHLELPGRAAFEAPVPWIFGEAAVPRLGLEGLLRLALDRRAPLAEARACRMVHGAGDGLPGVVVDRWGDRYWVRGDGGRAGGVRAVGGPTPEAVREALGRLLPEARFIEEAPAEAPPMELREILEWERVWAESGAGPVLRICLDAPEGLRRVRRGFDGTLVVWSLDPRLDRRALRQEARRAVGDFQEVGVFDEPALDFPRLGAAGRLKALALRAGRA